MDHIDTAIDSILRTAGSSLKNYTMHKTLSRMREAMKAALQERQDVIDVLIQRINHLEQDNGELMKAVDTLSADGT